MESFYSESLQGRAVEVGEVEGQNDCVPCAITVERAVGEDDTVLLAVSRRTDCAPVVGVAGQFQYGRPVGIESGVVSDDERRTHGI